jgi:hypothetical protein
MIDEERPRRWLRRGHPRHWPLRETSYRNLARVTSKLAIPNHGT